mmetsp:Transcript_12828/g.27722  ORF Transcript_12828/g.27722 Transcript_12828/m.27722 type:complete len:326 (+) Transcript_12828:275-1252(+)
MVVQRQPISRCSACSNSAIPFESGGIPRGAIALRHREHAGRISTSRLCERFYELEVGSYWSVGSARRSPLRVECVDDAEAGTSLPWGKAEVSQSSDPSGTTTNLLTLGHNGTVGFKVVYWANDPSYEELTEFFARKNREGLLEKLRPLTCSSEELAAQECNVALELITSDDTGESEPVDEEAAADDEEVDTHNATTAENEVYAETGPPMDDTDGEELIDNNSPADDAQDATTAVAWSDVNATGQGAPTALRQSPPIHDTPPASPPSVRGAGQQESDDKTPLQMIVLVVVGAALLALLVAGLLYLRRRVAGGRRRRVKRISRQGTT